MFRDFDQQANAFRPGLRLRSLRFVSDDEIELDFEGLDAPDATVRARRTWVDGVGWRHDFDEDFQRLYRGVPLLQAGLAVNAALGGAWLARADELPTGESWDRRFAAAQRELARRWEESHPDTDTDARTAAGNTVEELLDEARGIDWAAWSIPLPDRPFEYQPDTVVPAFERLVGARTHDEAQDAYNLLLSAVGHNHSGTPYTAMSPASPLLARLVPLLDVAGAAGMDALTDCALWSVDEPVFVGPDGRAHHLGQETRAALQTLEPLARQWSALNGDAVRRGAGRGLLEALADLSQDPGDDRRPALR